jgi:two-component system, NtrC family, sensor kinase
MKIPRPYTLQSQFFAGLTVAAVLIGGIFAIGFYLQMRNVLEDEVREKAEIIFHQVEAVQNYVRHTLRPRMYKELPDKFVTEAMSTSYVSRAVMQSTGAESGQFLYRRVAVGARNPDFEANEIELGLIDHFSRNENEKLWQGHIQIDELDHFVMARPVRFEKSCMTCHGEPSDAPPELIEKYGERGFWRLENSIGGIDFVGLPVSAQVGKVQQKLMAYLIMLTLCAILFFAAVNVLFKRVVVNNVRVLTKLLRIHVNDPEGQALFTDVQARDELEEMVDGVERLGKHIADNRQKLEEHAATLEDKVNERTSELARESSERKADVDLFINLLRSLNLSQTRSQLWRSALPLLASRFSLDKAGYVCTFLSNNFHVWPTDADKPQLPADWVELLTGATPMVRDNEAFIPVESSEGNTEGLLCLYRKTGECFRAEESDLLMAFGRQLGIAAENLGALDNILRHSQKLQSIFEGISDPLLLVDGLGGVIVTNEAARSLALELSGGSQEDGNIIPLLCAGNVKNENCGITNVSTKGIFQASEVVLPSGRSFVLGLHPVARSTGSGRVVIHVREVTADRKMLDQITRSEKMATVGKLAAGLAHEINNPLGVILCYAELLRKAATPEQKQDLEVIIGHTRKAREVLKNLLNFARPKVSRDRDTDIADMAETVSSVFSPQVQKKGAVVRTETNGELPHVRVEPQVVEHILANLLLNSLDALPEAGGEIVVSTGYDSDSREVVLTVRDNGTGIAPENLPRVFDPFFTTKGVSKGTGLGLTVIYGFMQDLGGRIEAFNIPGGGACFELRFPVLPGVPGREIHEG